MSENILRLFKQAITGKHQLQAATAHLVPKHCRTDTGQ
jgi:hypothetical protein